MIDTVHNAGLRFRYSLISSILNITDVDLLNISKSQSILLLNTRRIQNNLKVMNQIQKVLENIPYSYLDVIKNKPRRLSNIYINRTLSEFSKIKIG